MKTALAIFVGWIVAIHIFEIIIFPSMLYPNQVLSWATLTQRFTLIWTTNADTAHYMAIAKNGYRGESAAFFPLWPLVVRILGTNPVVAKIAVGFFMLVFVLAYERLITVLGYSKIKGEVILIFLAFPSSSLLNGAFSEPLFLALSAISLLFIEKRQYAKGALVASLASATRPIGILLTLYLGLKLILSGKENLKKYWWTLPVSAIGLIAYSVYLYFAFGNITLFATAQTTGWGRHIGVLSFLQLFKESMVVIGQVFGSYKPVPINLLQVGVTPFLLLLAIVGFKKINKPLWLYSLLTIVVPLYSGTYLGGLREILAAFPLFIPFGDFLAKRKLFFYFYIFLAMLFQSYLLMRFFNFEWVA